MRTKAVRERSELFSRRFSDASLRGVYDDGRGGWYYKLTLGRDPTTGRRVQVTKRGFRSAGEAARARKAQQGSGAMAAMPTALTVNDLLDLYLDGLDADGRLSAKTRFDYRKNAYVRPFLGEKRVGDVSPETVVAWQRQLMLCGGAKNGKALAVNTVRLARVPLAGAFRLAVDQGVITTSPLRAGSRPRSSRRIPRHWTPCHLPARWDHPLPQAWDHLAVTTAGECG